jgi:RND family efflux transporter MFP subunit
MKRKIYLVFAAAALLTACGGGETKESAPVNDSTTVAVHKGSESAQSNPSPATMRTMGKVVAQRFADLSFETALPIERVLVHNGQHVRRGQVLAQLDQFKLRNAIAQQQRAIEQAQLHMEQAHLQMQDVIIAQGYDPDKAAQVPDNVMHNADVKSGYALSKSQLASAKNQLAAAQHELHSGVLTAPFDGVVANVAVQAHQLAQAGQTVCRVIASGDMAVEFRVMEADLCRYQVGTPVSVIPVADKSQHYDATVSEINPVVDQQGAVTLRARLTNAATLFDGMNVEVILK